MKKAIFGLLLFFAANLSAVAFSDVPLTAWYANAVYSLVAKGILQDSPGQFQPSKTVNRAEMANLLDRALNYIANPYPGGWAVYENAYYSVLVPVGVNYNSDAWTDGCSSGLMIDGEYVWTIHCYQHEDFPDEQTIISNEFSEVSNIRYKGQYELSFSAIDPGMSVLSGGFERFSVAGLYSDGRLFHAAVDLYSWNDDFDFILTGYNEEASSIAFDAFRSSFKATLEP